MSNAALTTLGTLEMDREHAFGSGAAFTGSAANGHVWLPVLASPEISVANLAEENTVQRTDLLSNGKLIGGDGMTESDLTFSTYLAGGSETIYASGTSPTVPWSMLLLEIAYGGGTIFSRGPIQLGNTCTTTEIRSKYAEEFPDQVYPGSMITALGGTRYQARFPERVSGSGVYGTASLAYSGFAFTHVPADDSYLYGSHTAWLDDTNSIYNGQSGKSQAFQWKGHSTDDKVEFRGCRPSMFKLECELGKQPKCEWTFKVAGFVTGSHSGLSKPAFSGTNSGAPFVDGKAYIYDGSTGTSLQISKLTLTLDLSLEPEPDPNATYGKADWTRKECKATLELDPIYAPIWHSWFTNQSSLDVQVTWGKQPGKMFGFRFGNMSVDTVSHKSDRSGLEMVPITLVAKTYTGDMYEDGSGAVTSYSGTPISKGGTFSIG